IVARLKAKNEADTLIYQTEKTIKDLGEKISEDEKKDLESKTAALKELIAKEDFNVEDVKKSTDELMTKMQEVGSKMYEGAGSDAAAQPGAEGSAEPKAEDASTTDENKEEK